VEGGDEVGNGLEVFPALTEEGSRVSECAQDHAAHEAKVLQPSYTPVDEGKDSLHNTDHRASPNPTRKHEEVPTSGYTPPPILPWTASTVIALKTFWHWFLTPFGFLVTIYGFNVVAWGGMLFLLLCNASPAMCRTPVLPPHLKGQRLSPAASLALGHKGYPVKFDCNDIDSPRRIWLEIDSQILNALFCVTGFGLVPWRARDLYYLLRWRLTSEKRVGLMRKLHDLRVLAGIYRNWFRLPDSHTLDQMNAAEYERQFSKTGTTTSPATDVESGIVDDLRVPIPANKCPEDPPTGIRAPPTSLWKLDFFIWSQACNTFFQVCLCGFMWGMDRYDRPPWATGLFIALGCLIAGFGGLVSFLEGKEVRRVEGVGDVVSDGVARGGKEEAESEELSLERTRTARESIEVGEKGKG